MAEEIEDGWAWIDHPPEKEGRYLCGWKHSEDTFWGYFVRGEWFRDDGFSGRQCICWPYKWKKK